MSRTRRGIVSLGLGLAGLLACPGSIRAANTYLVNSDSGGADAKPGDGACATAGGLCTFTAAVQEANADKVPSVIKFAQAFQITGGLYALHEGGTTIDASDRHPFNGFGVILSNTDLVLNSAGNAIYGLRVDSVRANSGGNTIGGLGPGQGNHICDTTGVETVPGTGKNVIAGNYFCTDDGVNMIPNICNVGIASWNPDEIRGNLIGGCAVDAIQLRVEGSIVNGNRIGCTGTPDIPIPMPNATGIRAHQGGWHVITDNVVCENTLDGIRLHGSSHVLLRGNRIAGNGGAGIQVWYSDDVFIGEAFAGGHNWIERNKGSGISIVGSKGAVVKYTSVIRNGGSGIITDGDTQIVAPPGWPSRIWGNAGDGIHLAGKGAVVAGNVIGLVMAVLDPGNGGAGVYLGGGAAQCTIGGRLPGAGNWIGNNHQGGIVLSGAGVTGNRLEANLLGLSEGRQFAAGNGWDGIRLESGASGNLIGSLGYGNVVLASGWSGIALGDGCDDNRIEGNLVGTDGLGHHWGNAFFGVLVVDGAGNFLALNEVANNGTEPSATQAGVRIEGARAVANVLMLNSIHSNDGPGIELLAGGNGGVAAPVITSGTCWGGLRGTTCPNCYVEIYSDLDDEGKTYQGSLLADGAGTFHWYGPMAGPNVTATVLGPVGTGTSAFSNAWTVGRCSRVHLPLVHRGN